MQIRQSWIGTYQHLILEINIRLHKPADAKLETRRQRRILFKISISQTFWCQTLKTKKKNVSETIFTNIKYTQLKKNSYNLLWEYWISRQNKIEGNFFHNLLLFLKTIERTQKSSTVRLKNLDI